MSEGQRAGQPEAVATTGRRASHLTADAVSVVLFGLSAIGQAISMAVLIFAGPFSTELPRAIGSFVLAAGVFAIYIGLRSRIVPAASVVQDGPAIVMVTVAAAVGAGSPTPSVVDVFVVSAITTLSTGVVMWLLGRFRLGGLVQYLPTTVVGAFMAGTGWLLLKGGLDVMVGFGLGLDDVADLASIDLAKFWLPGVLVGVTMLLVNRSDRLPDSASGVLAVFSIVAFYGVVAAFSSVAEVKAEGWLIGPFSDATSLSLVTPSEFGDADWGRIFTSIPGITSVIAVAVMVALLNLTGLDSQGTGNVVVDDEIRTAGVANIVLSPLGTSPGFHGVADTLLLHRIGAGSRLVPVVAGVLTVAFGLFWVGVIGLMPRLAVGALLVAIGVALLADWLVALARMVGTVERLLSIGIVLIIAFVGILAGIGVGLVAACAVFIVRYSRVDPVRSVRSGHMVRSRVDREPAEVGALAAAADRLVVFELQGYLFFGSLVTLKKRLDAVVTSHADGPDTLDVVVLDLRFVTGIDSSSHQVIGQIAQSLAEADVEIVISSIGDELRRPLVASVPELGTSATWAPTLDHAIELVEESVLAEGHRSTEAASNAGPVGFAMSSELAEAFEDVTFAAGSTIMESGALSDGLLVVVSGELTALQVGRDGRQERLRRFGGPTVLGENGLITGRSRSATVVADSDVSGKWLSAERHRELRASDPTLLVELYELILTVQAARVVSLSAGLTSLPT